MAISNDPSVLAAASRCFDTCIPPGDQLAVKTYLLAQIAGVTDPRVVANNARCFRSCIPPGAQVDVQAYLSAVLAGGSTDPSTLLNNSTCFRSCVPPGASTSVANYALANQAGGSTDPATLANLARCFSSCIPPGMQLAAQSYLLGLQAGLTDPAIILTRASVFIGTNPTDPTIADEMITRWIVGGFVGGGATPPTPTGFAFTEAADNSVVNSSWNAPPAGVTYTELWTSDDNINFALTATVLAPGTSTTSAAPTLGNSKYGKIRWCNSTMCSAFTAVQTATNALDPLVVAWKANILSNGGTVTDATVGIVNTFTVALRAKASLFAKMIAMGPCVGDSLVAGFTPLIIPAGGTNIWTMTGAFPIIANCDFNVNGIRCDFGISTGANTKPSVIFPSTGNTGCTFYQFSNDGAHGPRTWDWGVCTPDEATSQWSGTTSAFGSTFFDCCNGATQFSVAASGLNGYYSWNSTAANARAIYFANSTHPHAAIATSAVVIGGPLPTAEALICGFNNNGSGVSAPSTFSSFRAFHLGLTSTESSDLFTLVQAMRVSLGGGFV